MKRIVERMRCALLWICLLAVTACERSSTTDVKRTVAESPAIRYDPTFLRRVVQDLAGGHVFVLSRARTMTDYRDVAKTATELDKGVMAATPFTFAEVQFRVGDRAVIGHLKGVPPERIALSIKKYIVQGALDSDGLALGNALAQSLGAQVGTDVSVQLVSEDGQPTTTPPRTMKVTGIFHTEFAEYDVFLGITSLASAQLVHGVGDSVIGVELALADELDARRIARALEAKLGTSKYQATDWCDLNRNLFGCTWRDEPATAR